MTYSAGGLIQAVDYNTFAQGGAAPDNDVANVNTIWGTGTLDKGWGQSSTVTAVSTAATVTATQWTTLFNRFVTIANQTNTSITAIVNPTVGDTIAVKNNFSTNLSSAFTNRNNAVGVGSTITADGVATYTNTYQNSLTSVHTITFASANAARYFFNAGGIITWTGARTGGSSTAKNTALSNLLTACGTLNFTTGTSTQVIAGTSYTGTTKTGGSGSPTTLLTGTGFYDLTTSDQEVFKQFDSAYLYTSDYVTVNIKANAAAGSATVITITVLYQNATFEAVDGTTTSTVTLIQPSTTYLSDTWGTPVLASSNPVGYNATYLVIGGGGGGGAGGGGAGGFVTGTTRLISGQVNAVVVGAGGPGGFFNAELPGGGRFGYSGTTSSLGTIFGLGGGGGAGGGFGNGSSGGSGGGGGTPGTTSGGAGTAGQGSAGGGVTGSTGGSGGGGGASAVGGSVSSSATGGAGGAGTASSITGSSVTYAGGGGGGGTTGGAGGAGGGGAGGTASATAGTANTGGGGGGVNLVSNGANGGSGVVILSVPTANYTGTTTGSPTVTTSGANTIMQFTSSGSYTS